MTASSSKVVVLKIEVRKLNDMENGVPVNQSTDIDIVKPNKPSTA
ncbi:hypothetical protein [Paenibacillus sp. P32E]|nr:hypothetical protein [Paenibacillus sp. P32E]